ncbi:MAG: TetR/AcrR family transcriptional regulator [Nitrospinae bacterium]|nr:TetR/AcrR family transcriptional regulator [Nitrospinota bacterium]
MRRSTPINRRGPGKPQQAGAKKQQILDAAARVFRQKGYNGATLRDIANEAGLLPGSLYYHIRSKEELLRLSVEQPIRELYAHLIEVIASETPWAQKLAQAIAAHLRAFDAHYPYLFVYLQNLLQVDAMRPRVQKQAKRYEELWQQILSQGVKSREFPADLDVKVASFALLGMCNWMHRWYRQEGRLSIDAIIQQFTGLILDGICRQPRD